MYTFKRKSSKTGAITQKNLTPKQIQAKRRRKSLTLTIEQLEKFDKLKDLYNEGQRREGAVGITDADVWDNIIDSIIDDLIQGAEAALEKPKKLEAVVSPTKSKKKQ